MHSTGMTVCTVAAGCAARQIAMHIAVTTTRAAALCLLGRMAWDDLSYCAVQGNGLSALMPNSALCLINICYWFDHSLPPTKTY